jgi:hypothetical protein
LRILTLRALYMLIIAVALLTAGAGDYRSSLLSLCALFSYASIVERYVHLAYSVSVVLHLACAVVGAAAFILFTDLMSRAYVVLCVVAPFIAYVAVEYEEEGVNVREWLAREG